MVSTGKVYGDHYVTIRRWARQDADRKEAEDGTHRKHDLSAYSK